MAASSIAAGTIAAGKIADKGTFWKGVSAGFLAGMAIAAALRYTPFEKFITNLSTVDGKLDSALGKLEVKLEPAPKTAGSIASREPATPPVPAKEISARSSLTSRDTLRTPIPETQQERAETQAKIPAVSEVEVVDDAAEPSTLAAARTGAVASFLRSGAIAGGRTTPARYPVPGIDLPRPDHIDLTRPAGTRTRNFDIGSAG
jgi:hypothetical protein